MADKRKSVRQDYVLRVRYQNTLPPPPFHPKMLALPTNFEKYSTADYLSNLYQEQPLRVEADSELGIHMDLSLYPGIFEGDESAMYAPEEPVELDPKDRALLRTDIGQQKLATDVSFLRRTQYISSEAASAAKVKQAEKDKAARLQADLEVAVDHVQQREAVDAMFTAASKDLSTLRHPTRKDLTAVAAFTVLPDFEGIEHQWCNAKFTTNPAPRAKSSSKMDDTDIRLDGAAILPKLIEETNDDYLSYFLPRFEAAEKLRQANDDSTAGTSEVYRLDGIRDYDARRDQNEDDYMLVFTNADGVCKFVPLEARMTLRTRRPTSGRAREREVLDLSLVDKASGDAAVEDQADQEDQEMAEQPGEDAEAAEDHREEQDDEMTE